MVAAVAVTGALTTGAADPAVGGGDRATSGVTVSSPAGVTLGGPDAHRFHLDRQRRLTADVYETAWTDGNTTVRVSTRARSHVRVQREAGRVTVDAEQAPDTAGRSDSELIVRQKRYGMSAVNQQVALGMDPAEARKTFAADDGEPPVIDTWCVDISAEGDLLQSHGCVVRHLDQDDEYGRYIADEMTTSALSRDYDSWFPYGLTRVDSILYYKGGEQVVKWSPISDKPVSECGSVEVGVEGNGGSVSVSTPICPDTFGPSVIPAANDPKFGAAWSGPPSDPGKFMGTEGVTLVKQAAGAPPTTLRNEITYSW
ncbi:hypothetical protein GCM10011579_082010 [Streptomyces albiflavescens]|uniref:Uncharacterized protein n=1 Tax=Streptomyces albiflavescens TaxID=1623582 RepID=A0A918D986_9ACTN|nr:hypothetical protein GCM10011579_082010 [Streptomyces albiflavescens]